MSPIIVPAAGCSPNDVLLIGEAPGYHESQRLEPFVGPSGEELERYLSRRNLSLRSFRRTNIVPEYLPGNPTPTPDLINKWTSHLLAEIQTCKPRLIVAVGGTASRFFLGEPALMADIHGLPHRGGEFDPSLAHRSLGAVIVPTYHPAFGLHSAADKEFDARTLIDYDYSQVASILKLIRSGRESQIIFRRDEWDGREQYIDCTGEELSDRLSDTGLLSRDAGDFEIGLDTERGRKRSLIQISLGPGTALVLRGVQPDYDIGTRSIQTLADNGCLIITHDAGTPSGCLNDITECYNEGLNLSNARLYNTMDAAYLLRIEPKGLKALMWRCLGMRQDDYHSTVGDIGLLQQLDYLRQILIDDWPKPISRIIHGNDGTVKSYKPQDVNTFVAGILRDVESGKLNKGGEPTNPYSRWMGTGPNKGIDRQLRKIVESRLGLMPVATLDDLEDQAKAVFYAGRDADGTRRLKPAFDTALRSLEDEISLDEIRLPWMKDSPHPNDKLPRLKTCRDQVLPIFWEMQHNGMPGSRRKFLDLHSFVSSQMDTLQSRLQYKYNAGRPFNPMSSPDVTILMRRRGLAGMKRTKAGRISTGKKSIEHLRYTDPAMDDVMTWRENLKVKTTFVQPLLDIADNTDEYLDDHPTGSERDIRDIFLVHCRFKPVTTTSRRPSAEDPNLLNQPVRTELGRRVRACYKTSSNEMFGGWDFSGHEARIAAHVCNSRSMIHLFSRCRFCGIILDENIILNDPCPKSDKGVHKGGDIHYNTAVRVFGVTGDDVDLYRHRLPAKTGFFGILNGMEGAGLLDQFRMYIPPEYDPDGHWSKLDNCKRLVDEIRRKVYPELHTTSEAVSKEIQRTGRIRDLFGMIRYLPAAWSDDFQERSEAARQGFNHVIQGTAASMTQEAMVAIHEDVRALRESRIVDIRWALQLYDEVIFRFSTVDYPADELWPILDKMVRTGLTQHCGIRLKVPIEADGHMGRTWSELK